MNSDCVQQHCELAKCAEMKGEHEDAKQVTAHSVSFEVMGDEREEAKQMPAQICDDLSLFFVPRPLDEYLPQHASMDAHHRMIDSASDCLVA